MGMIMGENDTLNFLFTSHIVPPFSFLLNQLPSTHSPPPTPLYPLPSHLFSSQALESANMKLQHQLHAAHEGIQAGMGKIKAIRGDLEQQKKQGSQLARMLK